MSRQQRVLPYGRQAIDEQDIAAVADVLRGDYLTTGPAVGRFEAALADRLGVDHAIAVSNGTAALHLVYAALGCGSGDTVIVPAITFLATANAVELLGARAVFADVDADSGLLTPETLERAFARAPGAKAVTAVHLNGQSCDMGGLAAVCARHGAALLEDAAHAIGSESWSTMHPGQPVGACADSLAACFSFHPVKTIAMGEGGAVTSNDASFAERVRSLRNHGMSRHPPAGEPLPTDASGREQPWLYYMEEPGFNYRITDIQCALGLSQLGRLDSFIAERQRLADRYVSALEPISNRARPIARVSAARTGWHLFPLLCLGGSEERSALFGHLVDHGIRPQVHYIPLPHQPYYRSRCAEEHFPGAERYYDRVLSLPLFVGLTDDEQDFVVRTVLDFFVG